MSALIVALVAGGVLVAILLVRLTLRGAIVERLALEEGERILWEERRIKVYRRIRRTAGGAALTYGVTVVVTDRRILVATGGPEGRRKFVILMILDHTRPAPPDATPGTLERGYPTYHLSPGDLRVVEEDGETVVRIEVSAHDPGPLFERPVVVIYTGEPERWRARFAPAGAASAGGA